jgi:hypothetical protein
MSGAVAGGSGAVGAVGVDQVLPLVFVLQS